MANLKRNPDDKKEAIELTFHWKYIILPLAILLLITVSTIIFYPQLTDEVAYRFSLSGSPKSWLSQQAILLFALLPQLILSMISIAITWGITKASHSIGQISIALKPERLLMLMGNIVALPQIIFGFVTLDIFIYNTYDKHLMPIWIFALIIMIIGAIVLAAVFIQAFKHSRNLKK